MDPHALDWCKRRHHSAFVESSEILADVLACVMGGPAAVASLWEIAATVECEVPPTHPPTWLRVFFGCQLLRALGIDLEKDPWLGQPVANGHVDGTAPSLDGAALAHAEAVLGSCREIARFIRGDAAAQGDIARLLVGTTGGRAGASSHRPPLAELAVSSHVHVMAALLGNSAKLLKQFIKQCIGPFAEENFFFYRLEGLKPQDPVSEVRFNPAHVGTVNLACEQIAKELLEEEALVLDKDIRWIAAATMLRTLRRPMHPNGRILHSLFYSSRKQLDCQDDGKGAA